MPNGAFVAYSVTLSRQTASATIPDTDAFRPESFDARNGDATRDFDLGSGFVPFSHGKHVCPGRHFAAMELKVATAYFLQAFDWRTVSGSFPAYKTSPVETARVNEPVRVVRRATAPPEAFAR